MAQVIQRANSADITCLEDIEPPFGNYLQGRYKKSFAYKTIKDRLPVILTQVIDTLSRNKEEIAKVHGAPAVEDIKKVVGGLSKLKNELVTNKPLIPLITIPERENDDAPVWNEKLEKLTESRQEPQVWYTTIWLICECYMYRRIKQEFLLTDNLKNYDPFALQKQESYYKSIGSISYLCEHILKLLENNDISKLEQEKNFIKFVKLNLWGNKCDLSLSIGTINSQDQNPLELLETLEEDILVDNSQEVWKLLSKKAQCENNNSIIDFVFDNAGYELFTDLCLSMFLIENKLTNKIRFYVKRIPWFISDVTKNDFYWFIETMLKSDNKCIQQFGQQCDKYLKNGVWTLEEESFWTEPFDYSEMKSANPSLYEKLSQAILVIFKGDLNYRKLLGDINWIHTTDFLEALRGFKPSNILSLRTVKADVCAGLPQGKAEELKKLNPNWMETGKYGLIQATICLC